VPDDIEHADAHAFARRLLGTDASEGTID
jgi:hypothetical protein